MKKTKKIWIGLIVLAMCNFAGVLKADAGEYLGDFCWDLSDTLNGTQYSMTAQLGIENIGGSHFLCTGVISASFSGTTVKFPAFGNVEILNNEIRITLSDQGKVFDSEGNYTVGIDMSTLILDPATLNGTSEGFGIYSGGRTELTHGTATFTKCQ
jgi:hypothetical protein